MPRYRIYYLKESHRQQFRHAPPSPGPVKLKMKDYQPGPEIEASSPYAAWKALRAEAAGGERSPIGVGDALEADTGVLQVCRYAGFEEAQWLLPEPPSPAATPGPQDPALPSNH